MANYVPWVPLEGGAPAVALSACMLQSLPKSGSNQSAYCLGTHWSNCGCFIPGSLRVHVHTAEP